MIKRLIIYFLPIFLFCGAQASAFEIQYNFITEKNYNYNSYHEWMFNDGQDSELIMYFDEGKYNFSSLPSMYDTVINHDINWFDLIKYCKVPKDHENAPVPEPATVVLISMGLIAFTYRRVRRLSR